jgi:hypothetical protein
MAAAAIIAMSTPRFAASQATTFDGFHMWSDIATIYKFGDHFRYDGDYGIRGLLTDDYWTSIYFRPSIRFKDRDWISLHGGFALFYNFLNGEGNLPELRPWLGARFTWPRPHGFTVTHYFRLEHRSFYHTDESGWDGSLRGRYQLQLRSPNFAIAGTGGFYVLTAVEVSDSTVTGGDLLRLSVAGDRLRIVGAIGRAITGALRIEPNYLFHKVQLGDETVGFEADDHVFRLRLFYTFE